MRPSRTPRPPSRGGPRAARREARVADQLDALELVEELVQVVKREIERGRVVVQVRVDEREKLVEAVLRDEHLVVERVPVGRIVADRHPMREEDGVLVVPVLKERQVVRTELFLKEELRIARESRSGTFRQPVRLRAERAEVTRVDLPSDHQPNEREG